MDIKEFDFELPEELIAHTPVEKRDECRLLVLRRKERTFEERIFKEVIEYLVPGDVLVLNNSRVVKSRIFPILERSGKHFEMLITGFISDREFVALVKNLRRLRVGDVLRLDRYEFRFVKLEKGMGVFETNIPFSYKDLDLIGEIPLPPYIEKKREKLMMPRVMDIDEIFYQTVYSSVAGSIASPTAGLHFTEELLKKIEEKGVLIRYITLHVGLGTFEPVRTEKVEDFKLKGEYMEVSKEVINDILLSKQRGNKVIAVGTTVVRALETVFRDVEKNIEGFSGITDIFIYPGFEFKVVDAMITNFHLPKSSLILLVSAFAGKDLIMDAYRYAIDRKFRFYSYGDAMFII